MSGARILRPGGRLAVLLATVAAAACFMDRLTAPGVGTVAVTLTADSVVAIGGAIPARVTISGATTGGPSRVLWSSSDPAVATVDSTGQVHGVAKGAVTIIGKVTAPELDSAVSRSVPVRVAYASIAIDSVDSLTGLGLTHTAQVRGRNTQGTGIAILSGPAVQWRVAPDTTVLTIDASGLLTSRANGVAFVVATFEGLRDSVPVKVRQVAGSVAFTGGSSFTFTSLNRDTGVVVTAVDVAGAPIASPAVLWSSANTAHATVSASGTMRALARSVDTIDAQVDTAKALLVTHVNQVPKALAPVAGGGQVDTVGRPTPVPPSVQVRDAGAAGIPGLTVVFTVIGNGGKIAAGSVLTDTGGVAATSWTLGDTVKIDSLRVTSGTLDTVAFTATAVASHAKTMVASSAPAETTVVNTTVPVAPAVAIRDTFGNAVNGVPVTFAVGAGGGSLTGGVVSTGQTGVAAVTSWKVGTVAGPSNNLVVATTAVLAGDTVVFHATALPGPASGSTSTIALSKDTLLAGQSAIITVRAKDAFGNPIVVGGATIALSFSGGVSRGTFSTVTDSGDGAYTANVQGTTAGSATTIGGTINGSVFSTSLPSLLVQHGAASQLIAGAGDNQTVTAGTTVPVRPSVVAKDNFQNVVPGDTVLWAVTTGGGLAAGDTTITDASGGATLGTWVLGAAAGSNAITASIAAVTRTFSATGTNPAILTSVPLGSMRLGGSPEGVAVDSTRNLVYVADSASNLVTVIDGAADTALDSITVGAGPTAVAVNAVLNRIYVANAAGGGISVIDGGSRTVVATVATGTTPASIAVDVVTDSVYVGNLGSGIAVVDGSTNTVIGSSIAVAASPEFMDIDPATGRLYVGGLSEDSVAVVDLTTRASLPSLPVRTPSGVAMDPVHRRLYVPSSTDGTLRMYDADADTLIAAAAMGTFPSRVAVDAAAGAVYMSNCYGDVSIIDGATLAVTGSLSGRLFVGCGARESPIRFAVNAAAHTVAVANPQTNLVTIDDDRTGSLLGLLVPVSAGSGLVVDGRRGRVYVATAPLGIIVVLDENSRRVVDAAAVTGGGLQLGIDPATNTLFAVHGDSTLTIIDASALAVSKTVLLPASSDQLAVDPVTNRVYVKGFNAAYVVDVASASVTATLTTGAVLAGIGVDSARNLVYLGHDGAPSASVFDGATNALIANASASGAQGVGLAVDPILNRFYVGDLDSPGHVIEYNGVTDSVASNIQVGPFPPRVFADARKGLAYGPNNASDLWVISGALGQPVTVLSPGPVTQLMADANTGTAFGVVGSRMVVIQP